MVSKALLGILLHSVIPIYNAPNSMQAVELVFSQIFYVGIDLF